MPQDTKGPHTEGALSTILDWYDDGEDFESILKRAEQAAVTERDMEFIEDIQARWKEYGCRMFLSEAQDRWLTRLVES